MTEQLVQLSAQCPRCGKREARRVAAWVCEQYHGQRSDRVVETVVCKCGALYMIRVEAYLAARAS